MRSPPDLRGQTSPQSIRLHLRRSLFRQRLRFRLLAQFTLAITMALFLHQWVVVDQLLDLFLYSLSLSTGPGLYLIFNFVHLKVPSIVGFPLKFPLLVSDCLQANWSSLSALHVRSPSVPQA